MAAFDRPERQQVERQLSFQGRGTIAAALFDLGPHPAAIPASDARVHGEVYEMTQPSAVLAALDEYEGYRPHDHESSAYRRVLASAALGDGRVVETWVYLYFGPLGGAAPIDSGDYMEYLKTR